jgi:ABC-2 type transport system ATP-binding protein
MEPLSIDVQDLTKKFGSFTAVDHVSFDVKKGEIFGFLGPNGAGKSTTIRMLCGILRPTSGRGIVGGFSIVTEPEAIKKIIGYMSQKFTLYGDLTVAENIDFHGGIHRLPPARLKERKEWVLAMAGLEGRENALTRDLSGGWKQRLALGCAILHKPEILFLDEPTASVDPASRRDFWGLIYELSVQGTTTFVTSHYMDEVERCHRIAIIHDGKIIAIGPPRELKVRFAGRETASLEEVFVAAIQGARTT